MNTLRSPWYRRAGLLYPLAAAGALAIVALIAAPTGGFPSRPRFQAVGINAAPVSLAGTINVEAANYNDTTGPAYRATDTAGASLIFTPRQTDAIIGTTTANDLNFVTNAASRLLIDSVGNVRINSTAPRFLLNESDAAADEKFYALASVAGLLQLETRTDVDGAGNPAIAINRTGTAIDLVNLQGTAIQANGVGVDSSLFVRKTATTSRASTTTATDDPHLTVSLASGVVYQIQGYLLVDSTSATPDFKYQFTRPTNTNSFITYDTIEQAVGVIAASANNGTFGSIFTVPLTVNNDHAVQLNGIIETTASGTFAISWAQNTSDVAATNLLAGSWIRLTRVN